KPTILALNKIDCAEEEVLNSLKEEYSHYEIIEISAKQNINLELLLEICTKSLPKTIKKCKYLIPYQSSSMAAYLHRNSIIDSEEFEAEGTVIIANVNNEAYGKCKEFLVEEISK
ncbi:MAG: GTPase HflX, partial [Fusobacteriaceae bacterium]